jgi:hypothetical protein
VLGRAVEDRRPLPVALAARTLGELDGKHFATLDRRPELDELGDLRIVLGDLIHLVTEPARLVPGTPHLEAVLGLCCRELLHGLPALDTSQIGLDALTGKLGALLWREDEVNLEVARALGAGRYIKALFHELPKLPGINLGRVSVEPVRSLLSLLGRPAGGHHQRHAHDRSDHQ